MDCPFLLQGIFPTQGSNLCLLVGRQILYRLSHQGSPFKGRDDIQFTLTPIAREVLVDFICIKIAQMVKNMPAIQETWVQSLGLEDPLEKGMATHSSILAWRIPQTEEPGGLQSTGSQRAGHN